MARTMVFVGAHPDDDLMALSGIVALHREDPDLRFVIVLATDGEGGNIAAGSEATPSTLGAVRRREAVAGWEIIGRQPDRLVWLGLADGGLADLPPDQLEAPLTEVLQQERPEVVITFGPDGISGHPDHIAVGQATDRAYARLTRDSGPGLRRLLHMALPQSGFDDMNAHRVRSGFEPLDPTRPYWPRGVPDDDIDVTVDLRAVWPRTRAAMQAHRSQWAPPWSEYDDEGWRRSAGARHFVQELPARDRGAGRLRSIFEGLGDRA